MAEQRPDPPAQGGAGAWSYCQRCGDTLPPFPALISPLTAPTASGPAPTPSSTCPHCGEPCRT